MPNARHVELRGAGQNLGTDCHPEREKSRAMEGLVFLAVYRETGLRDGPDMAPCRH